MDSNTLGVLTTLLIDVVGAICFLIGWLIFRKVRGDKTTITKHSGQGLEDLIFDESLDSQRLQECLDEESEKQHKNLSEDLWSKDPDQTDHPSSDKYANEMEQPLLFDKAEEFKTPPTQHK